MFKKLDKMLERFDKLNELVSDSDVISRIDEWKSYTKELAEITETVEQVKEVTEEVTETVEEVKETTEEVSETVEEVVNATEVVAEKAVELTEEIENLSDEMEAK